MLETIKQAAAWLSENVDPTVPRALFVVAVLVAVWLLRKTFPRAWEAFARVVRVPVIDPAPLLLLASKTWQALPGALIGGVTLALSTGGDVQATVKGIVFGALAALAHEVMKAVPWIPYQGTVGKTKLPSLPVLYLLGLVGFCMVQPGLTGCTPAQRAASADVVDKAEALAFTGGVVALLLLDDQLARHLDSLPHPTAQQLAAAQLRVDRLSRARAALAIVRQALAGELGDLDERGKLREAVQALDLVAAELEADGVRLPEDLLRALAAARVVL